MVQNNTLISLGYIKVNMANLEGISSIWLVQLILRLIVQVTETLGHKVLLPFYMVFGPSLVWYDTSNQMN